jgi:general secretion pathway protein G
MLYYPNKAYNPSRQTTTRHGFTLMELLVVVAILVVLAAVAVPSYFTYVEYSRRQAAATSARALGNAVDTYHAATGNWPQSLQELTQKSPTGIGATLRPEQLMDPWGHPYQYMPPPSQHNGENNCDVFTTAPDGAQIGNWRTQ